MSNIIYIDVDDTLADTRQGVYDLYTSVTHDFSGDIATKSKSYSCFCSQWSNKQVNSLFTSGQLLYDKIEPMPGAKEGVQALLRKGYDLRVVTFNHPSGIAAKQKWLEKYFPELSSKVYYLSSFEIDKKPFVGLAFIDDDYRNIEPNESTYPILLDMYNIYSNSTYPYRATSWEEVVRCL